ncbi:MAG: taurine catabolism dioxygenase TauD [Rhodospirillaceae bacterium]|nr:MAG: taurine catabolism dioxygenase TauD [Rhodospirillaceae bacterium]
MLKPFSLSAPDDYARWRDQKLANFPTASEDLLVEVRDLAHVSKAEGEAIADRIGRAGMAIYKTSPNADKNDVRAFGQHFGLKSLDKNPYADEDAITSLHNSHQAGRKLYIPYTNKAINWHTDGYYNESSRTIRAMVLHCLRPAGVSGGENQLFDPEIAYILMRDHDPEMIKALMDDNAMTIPGNGTDDHVDRQDSAGPVFSVDPKTETLHMRYTARKRHVIWADDEVTGRAKDFLLDILGGPYTFNYQLSAGEGLICNNVLHTRSAFQDGETDDQKRLILRARYWERLVL